MARYRLPRDLAMEILMGLADFDPMPYKTHGPDVTGYAHVRKHYMHFTLFPNKSISTHNNINILKPRRYYNTIHRKSNENYMLHPGGVFYFVICQDSTIWRDLDNIICFKHIWNRKRLQCIQNSFKWKQVWRAGVGYFNMCGVGGVFYFVISRDHTLSLEAYPNTSFLKDLIIEIWVFG